MNLEIEELDRDVSCEFLIEIIKPMSQTFKKSNHGWMKYINKRTGIRLTTLEGDRTECFGLKDVSCFKKVF